VTESITFNAKIYFIIVHTHRRHREPKCSKTFCDMPYTVRRLGWWHSRVFNIKISTFWGDTQRL